MHKRVRYGKQRTRPEIFGLSTLDTVSCALAGSIILLILMSALTDPNAPIILTEYRRIFQSGTGKDTSLQEEGFGEETVKVSLKNLVILHIRFPEIEMLPSPEVSVNGCGDSLTLSLLHSAEAHFPDDKRDNKLSIIVWRDSTSSTADCRFFTLEVTSPSNVWPDSSCNATLVAGAHVQFSEYNNCPLGFKFNSNADGLGIGDDVYRFNGIIN